MYATIRIVRRGVLLFLVDGMAGNLASRMLLMVSPLKGLTSNADMPWALAASKSSEKLGEEVVEEQQVRIVGVDWDGDRHAIEDSEMLCKKRASA